MGFALQSLLLCSFWGISSICGLKMTVLEFVMVSIIAGKFIGTSLGTINSTIPNLNDARKDKRMSGPVKSLNT